MKQTAISSQTPCLICDNQSFTHFIDAKDHFLTGETFSLYKCDSCGVLVTRPMPGDEILPNYYLSEKYISHSSGPKNVFELIYQTIRKYTLKQKANLVYKHSKGKNLLDIGCATGEFLMACRKKGFAVNGVEPNQKAREIAFSAHNLKIKDLSGLSDFEEHSFDVITMWHVLEHVSDINMRFRELRRLLKKGGVLIIAVPNPESYDAAYYKSHWAAYDVPRHVYHFNQNSMQILAQKHNFRIDRILPMKFDSFYISILSEKYRTGKNSFFRAFYLGLKSNLRAKHKNNGHSSLIYILSCE